MRRRGWWRGHRGLVARQHRKRGVDQRHPRAALAAQLHDDPADRIPDQAAVGLAVLWVGVRPQWLEAVQHPRDLLLRRLRPQVQGGLAAGDAAEIGLDGDPARHVPGDDVVLDGQQLEGRRQRGREGLGVLHPGPPAQHVPDRCGHRRPLVTRDPGRGRRARHPVRRHQREGLVDLDDREPWLLLVVRHDDLLEMFVLVVSVGGGIRSSCHAVPTAWPAVMSGSSQRSRRCSTPDHHEGQAPRRRRVEPRSCETGPCARRSRQ